MMKKILIVFILCLLSFIKVKSVLAVYCAYGTSCLYGGGSGCTEYPCTQGISGFICCADTPPATSPCIVGTTQCKNSTTVQTCQSGGTWLDTTTCDRSWVCQNGVCIDIATCTDDQTCTRGWKGGCNGNTGAVCGFAVNAWCLSSPDYGYNACSPTGCTSDYSLFPTTVDTVGVEASCQCCGNGTGFKCYRKPSTCGDYGGTCYTTPHDGSLPSSCQVYTEHNKKYYEPITPSDCTTAGGNAGRCCKSPVACTCTSGFVSTTSADCSTTQTFSSVASTNCGSEVQCGSCTDKTCGDGLTKGFSYGQTGCYSKAGNGDTCAVFSSASGYAYTDASSSGSCTAADSICCTKGCADNYHWVGNVCVHDITTYYWCDTSDLSTGSNDYETLAACQTGSKRCYTVSTTRNTMCTACKAQAKCSDGTSCGGGTSNGYSCGCGGSNSGVDTNRTCSLTCSSGKTCTDGGVTTCCTNATDICSSNHCCPAGKTWDSSTSACVLPVCSCSDATAVQTASTTNCGTSFKYQKDTTCVEVICWGTKCVTTDICKNSPGTCSGSSSSSACSYPAVSGDSECGTTTDSCSEGTVDESSKTSDSTTNSWGCQGTCTYVTNCSSCRFTKCDGECCSSGQVCDGNSACCSPTTPSKTTVTFPTGDGVITNNVTLSWNAVSGATFYNLGVWKDDNTRVLDQDVYAPTTSYTFTAPVGVRLHWQVNVKQNSCNVTRESYWSVVPGYFKVCGSATEVWYNSACCAFSNGGWSGWSDCTVSCGGGTKTRTCDTPSPSCDGTECQRLNSTYTTSVNRGETVSCNTQVCNSPPTVSSIDVVNINTGDVVPPVDNKYQNCDISFNDKVVRFVVTVSDSNDSVASVKLIIGSNEYTTTSIVGGKATFDIDTKGITSGSYSITAIATDGYGASSTVYNPSRTIKIWDCNVAVNGSLYDASGAPLDYVDCGDSGISTCFSKTVSSSYSLSFSGTAMDVTTPSYNGNLVWGRNYIPSFGFTSGSSPEMKVPGNSLCQSNFTLDSSLDNPYTGSHSLTINFSSILDQSRWWQVVGGGVKALTITDNIPSTCTTANNCSAAISVANNKCGSGLIVAKTVNFGVKAVTCSLDNEVNTTNGITTVVTGVASDRRSIENTSGYITGSSLNKENYSYTTLKSRFYDKARIGSVTSETSFEKILADVGGTGVVFVEGTLNIDVGNTVKVGDFLMVTAGSISIGNTSVTKIEGVFVSNSGIDVSGSSDTPLTINGMLYAGEDVVLNRDYVTKSMNNSAPSVRVVYRPDFLFNMPGKMTKVMSGWSAN